MAFNVIDLAKGYLTDSIIEKLSGQVGESSADVQKVIGSGMPALLGQVLKSGSNPSGLSSLMGLLNNQSDLGFLGNLSGMFSSSDQTSNFMSGGNSMLSNLLGDSKGNVLDAISSFGGVKRESTGKIMSFVAPILLGIIGKKAKSDNLDTAGLGNLLNSQAGFLESSIPSSLMGTLGLGSILSNAKNLFSGAVGTVGNAAKGAAHMAGDAARGASKLGRNAANAVEDTVEEVKERSSKFWPWIIGALLLLAALYFFKKCSDDAKETAENVSDAAVSVVDSAANTVANVADSSASLVGAGIEKLGSFFKTKLPNGVELDIPELGIENQLIKFISDKNELVTKEKWFNFDRINFDVSSAGLTKESTEQVKNISEILKAYPAVKIKVGGYTDNTGDPASNLKLSQSRAKSVTNAIIANGVEASRIKSEGYGEQHPVASNDTEEGKAQNRRISIRVLEK